MRCSFAISSSTSWFCRKASSAGPLPSRASAMRSSPPTSSGRVTFMNIGVGTHDRLDPRRGCDEACAEIFNIINEQTRRQVENPVTKVLREGVIVRLANRTILIRKDGKEFPIDNNGAPIRDKAGNTTGVVLVFRDITERKRAEERTEHLASFPQLNPGPILEVDASGEITFCNPGTLTILEDLGMGGGDCERFLPQDLGDILRNWDKKTESTLHREVLLKNRVFEETIHLLPQFNVARVYALDITERKQAEERLRESRARLDLALQSASMGAWHWDLVEDRRSFDDQVCRLLGIDPTRFTGAADEFFGVVHPDDREMLEGCAGPDNRTGCPLRAGVPDGLAGRERPLHRCPRSVGPA